MEFQYILSKNFKAAEPTAYGDLTLKSRFWILCKMGFPFFPSSHATSCRLHLCRIQLIMPNEKCRERLCFQNCQPKFLLRLLLSVLVNQWFSTHPVLWTHNSVPHVWWTANPEIISLILQTVIFVTVVNHNVNSLFTRYLICRPCEGVLWHPKGSWPKGC